MDAKTEKYVGVQETRDPSQTQMARWPHGRASPPQFAVHRKLLPLVFSLGEGQPPFVFHAACAHRDVQFCSAQTVWRARPFFSYNALLAQWSCFPEIGRASC